MAMVSPGIAHNKPPAEPNCLANLFSLRADSAHLCEVERRQVKLLWSEQFNIIMSLRRDHGTTKTAPAFRNAPVAAEICDYTRIECPSAFFPCTVSWDDIPRDVQHLIFVQLPFKKLAQLAPLCKSMRTAWVDRLAQRQQVVDSTMNDGTWPEAVTRGLSRDDTDPPRDLITPALVLPCPYFQFLPVGRGIADIP
jgi:hypothetical protein